MVLAKQVATLPWRLSYQATTMRSGALPCDADALLEGRCGGAEVAVASLAAEVERDGS